MATSSCLNFNRFRSLNHTQLTHHLNPSYSKQAFISSSTKKFPLNSRSIYAFTSRPITSYCTITPSPLHRSSYRHLSSFTNKRDFHFDGRRLLRWLGYWSPRIVIIVWGVSFVLAGAYLLKKGIETEGFSSSFDPGTGGDIAKDDWTMIDHDGKVVEKKDFAGKYSLIYFGFTFCPDVCPVEMEKLAKIADILEQRGIGLDVVQPVFVSVDYRRDTPDLIKNYIKQFTDGNDKKILGLCGTREQMEHFAKVMKTYFSDPPKLEEDYILEHSTYIYFTGKNGEFKNLTNTEDGPEVLANKVCLWIAQEKGRVAKVTEQIKQVFR